MLSLIIEMTSLNSISNLIGDYTTYIGCSGTKTFAYPTPVVDPADPWQTTSGLVESFLINLAVWIDGNTVYTLGVHQDTANYGWFSDQPSSLQF